MKPSNGPAGAGDARGRLRRSAEQIAKFIQDYQRSELSRVEFCRQQRKNALLWSSAYMVAARPICFKLAMHRVRFPCSLALAKAGNSRPAKIAMMAMTTSSSIRVKPARLATAPPTAHGTTLGLTTREQFEECIGNSGGYPFCPGKALARLHPNRSCLLPLKKGYRRAKINTVDRLFYNGPF